MTATRPRAARKQTSRGSAILAALVVTMLVYAGSGLYYYASADALAATPAARPASPRRAPGAAPTLPAPAGSSSYGLRTRPTTDDRALIDLSSLEVGQHIPMSDRWQMREGGFVHRIPEMALLSDPKTLFQGAHTACHPAAARAVCRMHRPLPARRGHAWRSPGLQR